MRRVRLDLAGDSPRTACALTAIESSFTLGGEVMSGADAVTETPLFLKKDNLSKILFFALYFLLHLV